MIWVFERVRGKIEKTVLCGTFFSWKCRDSRRPHHSAWFWSVCSSKSYSLALLCEVPLEPSPCGGENFFCRRSVGLRFKPPAELNPTTLSFFYVPTLVFRELWGSIALLLLYRARAYHFVEKKKFMTCSNTNTITLTR